MGRVKGSGMKPVKRGIGFVQLGLFVLFLVWLGMRKQDMPEQQKREKQQEELVQQPQETEAPIAEEEKASDESPIDFAALRAVNPDIVAWLMIPGTVIDYPVVQTDNNETYLKKNAEGITDSAGAIYLDCDSDRDLDGRHSIFYGHHMKNGTMFADIVKFKNEDFFKENREIILYLPEKELHLRTIAALYGDAGGEKRRTQFEHEAHFHQYLDEMTKGCAFRELPVSAEHLYSFVTCSYEFDNARTILYAVPEFWNEYQEKMNES